MVPVAVLSAMTPLAAADSSRLKVSSGSTSVSPWMVTATLRSVIPGGKYSTVFTEV